MTPETIDKVMDVPKRSLLVMHGDVLDNAAGQALVRSIERTVGHDEFVIVVLPEGGTLDTVPLVELRDLVARLEQKAGD